ncbi:hypothetical protein E5D57_002704 [Metarhizium anisopliae]|nr:hypothetical protein E5D57_002704 [Metarhizium anisopliae]
MDFTQIHSMVKQQMRGKEHLQIEFYLPKHRHPFCGSSVVFGEVPHQDHIDQRRGGGFDSGVDFDLEAVFPAAPSHFLQPASLPWVLLGQDFCPHGVTSTGAVGLCLEARSDDFPLFDSVDGGPGFDTGGFDGGPGFECP